MKNKTIAMNSRLHFHISVAINNSDIPKDKAPELIERIYEFGMREKK